MVIRSSRGSGSSGRRSRNSGAIGWSTLSSTPLSMAMPTSADITVLDADLMLAGESGVASR